MKTIVRLTFLSLISAILFSSCIKVAVTPQNPIVGSWVLSNASEGDAYGWSSFYTGVEGGVFTMYQNGTATYDDADVSMSGYWNMSNAYGGYFDQYGSYINGQHQTLTLDLRDSYTNSSIYLNFDNVNFYGNRFVATYFNGNLIEKYTFSGTY